MGNYNPHAPYILGNEWVPIRDASYKPDQITERGYSFRLDYTAAAVSGAYYVKEPPAKTVTNVAELIYVYPAGREDKTGPIRRVVIPVSSVGVTGFGGVATGTAASLANPSDNEIVQLDTLSGVGAPLAELNFSIENYSQQLFGKRILGVRLAYTAGGTNIETLNVLHTGIGQAFDLVGRRSTYQSFVEGPVNATTPLTLVTDVKYVDFGDTNITLTQPIDTSGSDPSLLALPWRYEELLLLSPSQSAGTRRSIFLDVTQSSAGGSVMFGYAALEIFYCEETRVRYGGYVTNANTNFGAVPPNALAVGANFVQLKDTSFAVPSALAAGEYVITHVHRELKPTFVARDAPTLHAVRQLYELPSHRGVQVDARVIEDSQFSVDTIDELTPLTLHTASAVVTGTHPYGTRIGAPVYGTVTAVQEIEDDPVGGTRQYQQVRFYARRFGETTVPLTLTDVATGLSTVSISVADFDALTEIVDGWREVTLRFATPPTFTTAAGDVDWRWTATGEVAYNQWQVLGADGPSPSGSQTTGPATYFAPQGANVTLNWQSPSISGSAEDTISDATLIFSQDPPSVTGFAISTCAQVVTGVGLDCLAVTPRCVPTAIYGNRLTWTPFGVCDNFNRVNVDTWNTATSGQDWTLSGGTASNFFVNGRGRILLPTGDTASRSALQPTIFTDIDQFVTMSVSQVATGASINAQTRFRLVDSSNNYTLSLAFDTTGNVDVSMLRVLAGATTTMTGTATLNNFVAYSADSEVHIYIQSRGSSHKAKIWVGDRNSPPVTWSLEGTDSSFFAGQSGVRAVLNGGNTNVNPVVAFENFSVSSSSLLNGGQIEIQRRDALTDWQTIMHTYTPECVTAFCDFEARVGQLSDYRIRTLNALDFAGPWATGSGTIAAPGVTVSGDGNSTLIFTNNAFSTASLAYVMQWEGQPIETFAFPEADTVQLLRLFGRDFFTAFHPLERGGEQFTRVLLVNAAAVALPSLGNFRGLRDLAWADLDYVCVRDELGNRWFANVRVPEGSVQRNRTIYLAQVQVAEVTDTPSPVDPGA